MDDARTLALAAGFGGIAGLRTFSAPLAIADSLKLEGGPLAILGSSGGLNTLAALALSELVADKTPFIPSRTTVPALFGRFVSGALAGASVAHARKGNRWAAALIGGSAAIGAAFAGYELRKRIGSVSRIPDPLIAVMEDALVAGSSMALVAMLKRQSAAIF
jgi:uncharacterized membrane protein